MKNNYSYLLIALISISSCTKELEADEFTPCGENIQEIKITPNWTAPLDPVNSHLYKPMKPIEYNGHLIHSIGYGQEQIIVKRDLETKEIVLQKEILRLDYDGAIIHNHELIYVELGRILALNLNSFETRIIWQYSFNPHYTEIEKDIIIVNEKLIFTDLKQLGNSNYIDQLISLDIENLTYDVLYEWNEKAFPYCGIYRFKLLENHNGNQFISYLEGIGISSRGYLTVAKLGCVNLTNKSQLFEKDILEDYDDGRNIEGYNIYQNQINIELRDGSNTQYKSYNVMTGELLWSNDYNASGTEFRFNEYNEKRNSITIISGSELSEINLTSGESINREIALTGLKSLHHFQLESKIAFVQQNTIRLFDLEIGCITKSITINKGLLKDNVQNDIFYNENRKEIYAYTLYEFIAIPYE